MLRLNDLSIGYKPGHSIVTEINADFKRGQITSLMGLNGSGKSTLLKTVLGLLPSTKGDILLEEKNLTGLSLAERAGRISLLESHSRVAFPMPLEELIQVGARRHAKGYAKRYDRTLTQALISRALDAVELKGYEKKNLLELSAGETRRAFIAHALVANTDIIMIDEPFAHLDWSHQRRLCQALMDWRDFFKTSFILAVHELDWIVKLSDQVCVLGQGRILSQGSVQDVFDSERVHGLFDFQAQIDRNPLDGSPRLTVGRRPSTVTF